MIVCPGQGMCPFVQVNLVSYTIVGEQSNSKEELEFSTKVCEDQF